MATNIFLRPGAVNPYNVVLRDPTQADSGAALEATQNELAAAIEAIIAEGLLYASATETTTANDATTAIGLALADCTETASANDVPAAAIVAGAIEAGVDEQCVAVDSADAPGSIYGAGINEAANASDENSATGGSEPALTGGGRQARPYYFHPAWIVTHRAKSAEYAIASDATDATVQSAAVVVDLDQYRRNAELLIAEADRRLLVGWR
jgi:hypothetical protein